MKYFNFKRYKFNSIIKKFTILHRIFFKSLNYLNFKNFLNFKKYTIKFVLKYLDFKAYNYQKIYKKLNIKNYKLVPLYFLVSSIFIGIIYLIIPLFFNYDKLKIEKVICQSKNIKCEIKGNINYAILPTPRIKIRNLIVADSLNTKKYLLKAEVVEVKLSLKNLIQKEKQKFVGLEFNNFEINLNVKNYKEYKSVFKKEINYIPAKFTKGKLIFNEGNVYIGTVSKAFLDLKFLKDSIDIKLKGKFLEDKLSITLNSEKIDNKNFTDITLKMKGLNLLTKVNLNSFLLDNAVKSGTILIKQRKNKITSIFNYKDNKLNLSKSNISNNFFNGKLDGSIVFLPFFDFDLNINLNSIYFTKLYKYFLSLDDKVQRDIFKVNSKINGKLSLSSDKIYSNYNLVKSFESRIKFNNGNILIDQFLINLGKLGAADILGAFESSKKFTKFKFESNVFVDNQKKFLSKFGIYNKKNISSNIFISGNFDLKNKLLSFYEILENEKLNEEEIIFIEQEFNDHMLDDGFQNLFVFSKFKEFIKSITEETN